ncbi:hypothetical protein KY285_013790 [Solanum tuberosum]|nr:hypothetical protein KY285_013790 [Solanum tuberosum]
MSLGSFVSCNEETKVYIVYLGEHNGDKTLKEIEDHYFSFVHSVKGTTTSKEDVRASLVHSYKNVINGFSAVLTPQEVDMISDPFQFRGWHFRPSKAADPGLVYDASYQDYLLFLCASGVKDLDKPFKAS